FLSLKGSLKRIAFEHQLSLADRVVESFLNEPATIFLWEGYNGRLNEGMYIIDRTWTQDLFIAIAKIIADDQQISLLMTAAEAGSSADVYRLKIGPQRELYFSVTNSKIYVFTHPKMKVPDESLLSQWMSRSTSPNSDGNREGKGTHSIVVSMKYLTFGYQSLFPDLANLRFDYSKEQGWLSHLQWLNHKNESANEVAKIWDLAPTGAALCVAVPVDLEELAKLAAKVGDASKLDLASLVNMIQSPLGICWYASSKFYTPLILASTKGTADPKNLNKVFESLVGGLEAGILTAEETQKLAEQMEKILQGEKVENPVKAKTFKPAIAVKELISESHSEWSRQVSSRFGHYPSDKSPSSEQMRSKFFFNVKLATTKSTVFFSPDDRLVDNAIAVSQKKFPALSDSLRKTSQSMLVFSPTELAELIKQSAIDTLPASQESIFRESVIKHLFPALESLKKYPNLALHVNDKNENENENSRQQSLSQEWRSLQWQDLSK
ncbi:MAG: DUF2138 family protein, partial [Proteobacteria bacterium]|nr:DUF2138 family protein [Pseudomonadota bacterium]